MLAEFVLRVADLVAAELEAGHDCVVALIMIEPRNHPRSVINRVQSRHLRRPVRRLHVLPLGHARWADVLVLINSIRAILNQADSVVQPASMLRLSGAEAALRVSILRFRTRCPTYAMSLNKGGHMTTTAM